LGNSREFAVLNVLVVESDAIVRNLLINVLSLHGFTVYEATSEREALNLCKSLAGGVDLLITDHETAGRAMTEEILACCQNIQVLHISGWPFELVEKKQALVPGSSFLKKPFTTQELLLTVRNLLNPQKQ